ncbi:MAG TPA: amidohydrolase family protein, partial [Thermoanaerobaculia bacterium]|nr:amidohydrolase family protein [Thermoanaerobaculia bacterium]
MTRPVPRTACAAAALTLLFAGLTPIARAQNADFVWYGGPILAGKDARPEALAVKDGKIVALGSRADVEKKWKGKSTLPIDLNGQTLVAGLVPTPMPTPPPAAAKKGSAKIEKPPRATPTPAPKPTPTPPPPSEPAPPLEALGADVSPPPAGLPYTIASVRDALRMWILRSSLPKRHRVVVGFGYDETKLAESRPPTREELDTVSATLPVIVVSRAGDAGAYNTLALQKAGISWRSKDPPGGTIVRRGRIQEPNGVLVGAAHAAAFAKLVPRLDEKERARLHAESVRLNTPEEP